MQGTSCQPELRHIMCAGKEGRKCHRFLFLRAAFMSGRWSLLEVVSSAEQRPA